MNPTPSRAWRGLGRLFLFISVSFVGVMGVFINHIARRGHAKIFACFTWWRRQGPWALGVNIQVKGEMPDHATILVPNHRSYVDVALLPSPHPMVFVAKAEVRKWPMIGFGANLLRTIWVDRASTESRRNTRIEVKKRIEADLAVVIFPEGTTHIGPDILPYKMGMFKMCADGDFPMTPIAMEYRNADIAWVGNDWFIPHFIRVFGRRNIDVKVCFGPVMRDSDPVALHNRVTEWTARNLLEMRAEWDALAT
jgi:1-acyl-sn-glycerol-3-phosphate acyltransferase